MIFAVGGSIWLLISAGQFARWGLPVLLPIAVIAAAIIFTGFRIRKRGGKAGENAYTDEERRRTMRKYVIVNLVTWAGAFIAVNVLGNTAHNELILSALIAIVGLHMFFMPPAYRYRSNTIAGACLIAWAVLASFVFRGRTIAGAATLGAGLILWASSAIALKVADSSLRNQGL